MKINATLEFILLGTVLLFMSSVTISNANPMRNQCTDNSQCHSTLTCMFGECTDPCSKLSQGDRATCLVNNHTIQWICNPGFEYPEGGNHNVCLPVEWSCYVDKESLDHFIKCKNPRWRCVKSSGEMICGLIDTTDDEDDFEDDHEDYSEDEFDNESCIESDYELTDESD